jgi:hypothetical protein
MAKSVLEYLGTGGASSYIVHYEIDMPSNFYPHGYLSREHILVYDENDVAIAFTWDTPTGNTITVDFLSGERFFVRGKTPRDELYVEWADGAVIHDRNLTAAHLQHLMIVQEIDDGFVFGIEDPDNSFLAVIFRGIRVPDEVEPINKEALLVPHVADRRLSIFSWDILGNILAVTYKELFDLIGGVVVGAGAGLTATSVTPGDVRIDVGQGIGMLVLPETINLAVPQNKMLYAMKDDLWVRPDAVDIVYTPQQDVGQDEFNVNEAIRINTALILALTSGARVRGNWDATANLPDIDALNKRSGDYWNVSVAGNTPLTPNPTSGITEPLTNWLAGEKALYGRIAIDGTSPIEYDEGWFRQPIPDYIPADNVLVHDNLGLGLAESSQLEHESARTINDAQDLTLDSHETRVTNNEANIATNTQGIAENLSHINTHHDEIVELQAEKEPLIDPKNTAFNKNFTDPVGVAATDVVPASDPRLSDSRPPTGHDHSAADVTTGILEHGRVPYAVVNATTAGKVRLTLSGNVLTIFTQD